MGERGEDCSLPCLLCPHVQRSHRRVAFARQPGHCLQVQAAMQVQAARPSGAVGALGQARPARAPRLAVAASAVPREDQPALQASRRQALVAGLGAGAALWLPGAPLPAAAAATVDPSESIYSQSALMFGEEVALEKYKGQVGVAGRTAGLRRAWQERTPRPGSPLRGLPPHAPPLRRCTPGAALPSTCRGGVRQRAALARPADAHARPADALAAALTARAWPSLSPAPQVLLVVNVASE